jgi:hypothetical protein
MHEGLDRKNVLAPVCGHDTKSSEVFDLLYVIIGHDGPDAKRLRPQLRPSHLEHLSALAADGRIKLAGPLTDGYGSLIIVDAESKEEVQRMVSADPYNGPVFARVEIHPFKQVFPE